MHRLWTLSSLMVGCLLQRKKAVTRMTGHRELYCFTIIQCKLFRPFQMSKGLVPKTAGTVQVQTSRQVFVPAPPGVWGSEQGE